MKSFIFLRQNADRLSKNDAEELAEILKDCSTKLEKIIQRLEDK